ncbi:MAG TPA: AAA family ATPase, partial [Bryobacteraceae bacterium]|nr:AAA family ATPase [Bryobacteraceae bacterium]
MQDISPREIIRRITVENPWWADSTVSQVHRSFSPRAYLDLFFPLVSDVSVRRAVVLLGPRRVGKTFMIHHAIQKLISGGVPPKSICYLSMDSPLYNGLGLERLLEYFKQATEINYETEPIYVFFDEVQYLREWEQHLKVLVDTYPKIKVTVSGSAAAALRLSSEESGAGRFTDFLLPPLTFHEYLVL